MCEGCILLGDLNLDYSKLNDVTYSHKNFFSDFDETLVNCDLIQLVGFVTWSRMVGNMRRTSILDHVYWKAVIQVSTQKHDINVQYLYDNASFWRFKCQKCFKKLVLGNWLLNPRIWHFKHRGLAFMKLTPGVKTALVVHLVLSERIKKLFDFPIFRSVTKTFVVFF